MRKQITSLGTIRTTSLHSENWHLKRVSIYLVFPGQPVLLGIEIALVGEKNSSLIEKF